MHQGLENLSTSLETEKSLRGTYSRWLTRESLSKKLGRSHYAMAEYDKIKRITIPIGEEGIILITMEPQCYHEIVTKEVVEIADNYFSGLDK